MARIALVEAEAATPEVRELYNTVLRGKPGNIQKALAHRPEMLQKFLPFYASVGRSLDRKLYEEVYLRISLMNGCDYCSQHHVSSSKKASLGPDDWSALKKGDYSRFPERDQVALRYAAKVTKAPDSADDSDFAELKKHFSDSEIVDLQMLIGLVNLTNRVTGPLALDLEFAREEIR